MRRLIFRTATYTMVTFLGVSFAPLPCGAQPASPVDDLSVTADGSTQLPADAFRVRIAFEATGKSATEAQAALEKKRQAIIAALSTADKSSTTTLLGVTLSGPNSDTAPLTSQGIVKAKGIIAAEGADINKMSLIVDGALTAGATAIEEASSVVRSSTAARNEAIRTATENAKKKAESVAQTMGVTLGRALSVSVIEEPQGKVLRMRRQAGDDMEAVGETLMILVNARYEIIRK